MDKSNIKLNILKRCIGKKYLVKKERETPWFGEAVAVVDDSTLKIKSKDFEAAISIFDIRNPYQEI